jgi:hypothetical protein
MTLSREVQRAWRDHSVTAIPSVKRSLLADLPTLQPQRRRKGGGNPKEVKLHQRRKQGTGIACQSLVP